MYPGAAGSTTPVPGKVGIGLPPAYRKVARAEVQVPASLAEAMAWYRSSVRSCGFILESTMPLQRHGGPAFAGLDFVTRDGLSRLSLVFRPLSARSAAVLYVAQTLDLPARPPASFLRGPFIRVNVDFRIDSALPNATREYRFVIAWPATVARLVALVNRPTRIWVPIGSGGAVISSQSATLSFVRPDGGVRRVFLGSLLGEMIVGHTRPLVDPEGVTLKRLAAIALRRCGRKGAC